MDSLTYWKKREEAALKKYITDEREYKKEIDRIYAEMLDSIQTQINAFYSSYATKAGISLSEARKAVKRLDIAAYERKAKRYVRTKDFSARANAEMLLYNATMKINRLEMLKANIGLETVAGFDELQKYMEGILQGRTMEELERQAGILGKSIRNNAQLAHSIVNASYKVDKVGAQSTFSDRIWMYQDQMRNDLGKLLATGLIQGKNPRVLAKDLRHYWYGRDPRTNGGARFCMERLMRTELARVQTEAQRQSYVRNDFEQYTFIANHDCCKICKDLDGKHFYVKDMMPGENASPMHPFVDAPPLLILTEQSMKNGLILFKIRKSGRVERKKQIYRDRVAPEKHRKPCCASLYINKFIREHKQINTGTGNRAFFTQKIN